MKVNSEKGKLFLNICQVLFSSFARRTIKPYNIYNKRICLKPEIRKASR